jgi:hypothetical protein
VPLVVQEKSNPAMLIPPYFTFPGVLVGVLEGVPEEAPEEASEEAPEGVPEGALERAPEGVPVGLLGVVSGGIVELENDKVGKCVEIEELYTAGTVKGGGVYTEVVLTAERD